MRYNPTRVRTCAIQSNSFVDMCGAMQAEYSASNDLPTNVPTAKQIQKVKRYKRAQALINSAALKIDKCVDIFEKQEARSEQLGLCDQDPNVDVELEKLCRTLPAEKQTHACVFKGPFFFPRELL